MPWDDLGDLENRLQLALQRFDWDTADEKRAGTSSIACPAKRRPFQLKRPELCCRRYAVNAALLLWVYSPRPFWSRDCERLKFAGGVSAPANIDKRKCVTMRCEVCRAGVIRVGDVRSQSKNDWCL